MDDERHLLTHFKTRVDHLEKTLGKVRKNLRQLLPKGKRETLILKQTIKMIDEVGFIPRTSETKS